MGNFEMMIPMILQAFLLVKLFGEELEEAKAELALCILPKLPKLIINCKAHSVYDFQILITYYRTKVMAKQI